MDLLLKCKIVIDNFTAGISRFISSIFARVNWLYVRLSLIVIGVISTFISPTPSTHTTESVTFIDLLMVFAFCVVGLQFVIGVQVINSRSDRKWLNSSWHQNPFNFRQPVHFFHFGGWFLFLSSLPSVISSIGESQNILLSSFMPMIFGIGLLSGVHVSTYVFKNKYSNT